MIQRQHDFIGAFSDVDRAIDQSEKIGLRDRKQITTWLWKDRAKDTGRVGCGLDGGTGRRGLAGRTQQNDSAWNRSVSFVHHPATQGYLSSQQPGAE